MPNNIEIPENAISQCFEVKYWIEQAIERNDVGAMEVAEMKAEYIMDEIKKSIANAKKQQS